MPARLASLSGAAVVALAAFFGALAVTVGATGGGARPEAATPVGLRAVPLERAAPAAAEVPADAAERSLRPVDALPALAADEPDPAPAAAPAPAPAAPAPAPRSPRPAPRSPALPALPPPAPAPAPEPVSPPPPEPVAPAPAPVPAPAPEPPPVQFDDSG